MDKTGEQVKIQRQRRQRIEHLKYEAAQAYGLLAGQEPEPDLEGASKPEPTPEPESPADEGNAGLQTRDRG